MATVDLSTFDNSWYRPGALVRRLAWYICNIAFIKTYLPYPSSFKKPLLTLFGAKVGINVTIKPGVNIKFPWLLEIGDNVWIGEAVWIDNLGVVKIGDNVCLSQGSYILTGNHNYKKTTFDLIVLPVTVEDGVWVGAKAILCPGVVLGTHSVITVGSVVTKNTEPWIIYSGNPALAVRARQMA